MTENEIKNLLMYYGQNPSGRDFALLSAIAAIIASKRTWVGLKVREIEWCFADANDDHVVAARAIEAKLKEKNDR